MTVVVIVILVAVIVAVGYAAVTGKLTLTRAGCCCPADPRQDLRMRAAFEEPLPNAQPREAERRGNRGD